MPCLVFSAVVISREVMQMVYMRVAAEYYDVHGPRTSVVTHNKT